jgi:hypothetical protein
MSAWAAKWLISCRLTAKMTACTLVAGRKHQQWHQVVKRQTRFPRVKSQSQECDYNSDESLMKQWACLLTSEICSQRIKLVDPSASVAGLQSAQATKATPSHRVTEPSDAICWCWETEIINANAAAWKYVGPTTISHIGFLLSFVKHTTLHKEPRPEEYILSFWQRACSCTNHSYYGKRLDELIRNVVLLALTPFPIRSLEEYCFSLGSRRWRLCWRVKFQ